MYLTNFISTAKKMENTLTIVLTAVTSLVIGLFGKDRFNYLIRKQELKTEHDCHEKIKALECQINNDQLRLSRITTGVEMILVMFEKEFEDSDKHTELIGLVRESLSADPLPPKG